MRSQNLYIAWKKKRRTTKETNDKNISKRRAVHAILSTKHYISQVLYFDEYESLTSSLLMD